MREKPKAEKVNKKPRKRADIYITLCVIGLVLFGVVMVYSASYMTNAGGFGWLLKQLGGVAVGFVAMFAASMVNYRIYAKPFIAYTLLAVAVALLALVLVPGIGVESYGARRWFSLPVIGTFQPSEIAKCAVILFMAQYMARNPWWYNEKKGWFSMLAVIGIMAALIMAEPNLSTTACIAIVGLFMMLMGGGQYKWILTTAGVGIAGVVALIFSASYRRDRFLAFLAPFKYKDDEAYQLVQSLYAFGDGGLFGIGLGKSRQKTVIPFSESDFIFSIIGEELGLIGALLVLGVFAFLIWRGMKVALTAPDRFGTLLAGGIVTLIAVQVVINIAVVTGCMPPTGIPLPFISKGNTALVVFMGLAGVLLNISKQARQ